MVLLSQMIRTAAITGRTDTIGSRLMGRQGGRWAEQTVRAAIPTAGAPADTLRELIELHERGVVTDAELEKLRADLHV